MNDKVNQLKQMIDQSHKIVFFTGAGISVASGIPDFRSIGGINDAIAQNGYTPEYILSADYLRNDPAGFIDFCYQYLLFADKKPNRVHQWIAELEAEGRSLGVITQNIDGLHSDAGNQRVDELHGTMNRFYCTRCDATFTKSYVLAHQLRHCDQCGGHIRPDIVLYGEMLDQETLMRAMFKIHDADTLIVLGSSLVVQPAAGFVSQFNHGNMIIINREPTPYDYLADLVIHEDMVKVIAALESKKTH
ncbi:NAD-dependent protein deacylase [Staphylococcus agnetis]|uniref:NAD-dependent protein deacylase n=1 Tax=Staphylococcus agnetis TaxID=985762 RepID=UPI0021D00017|nr:NAD-dependent protein deacylase [Staphylococcus agnetis]UXU64323.1 NAD-dependent protein deacylase [Staphylococcus agnetis]UXU66663.1 NAD-dependent protein deacylase [Staphylococcus agnetis]